MKTQQMLSYLRRCTTQYKMINDGDKIAVGISGGKDSLTLLKLLAEFKKFSPEKFDLIGVAVDLQFNKTPTDYSKIQTFCDELGVPFYVVRTDIGEIIFDVRKESSPCSLCAKMRKGALYDKVSELGFNKVALGHHRDDLIETLFLSLFYEGRLSTFAPKSYLSKTNLTLIRPLLFTNECDVQSYAKDFPVAKSKCPADKNTKREYVKDLLKSISKDVSPVREMIFTALTHPERYNLFDKFESEIDKF